MKRLGIALAATVALVGAALVAVDDKGDPIADTDLDKALSLKMAAVCLLGGIPGAAATPALPTS